MPLTSGTRSVAFLQLHYLPEIRIGALRGAGILGLCDALGFIAQLTEIGLREIFPTGWNRNESSLFAERLEGQPTSAVTFGENYAALTAGASVCPASTLSPAPSEILGTSSLPCIHPPLNLRRLRVPHLPVGTISVYESSI